MRILTVLALSLSLVLTPRLSTACDWGAPPLHELDLEQVGVDVEPPSAIQNVEFEVFRGEGPNGSCGLTMTGSSCHGVGRIELIITPPTDDGTPTESLGYMVVLVDGEFPKQLEIEMPGEPWRGGTPSADSTQTFVLHWEDGGGPEDHERIDFTLDITPMDLAGNEGPAFRIRVRDRGDDAGCSQSGRASDPVPLIVLMLLVLTLLWASNRYRPQRL